jgi:hypothetical protein
MKEIEKYCNGVIRTGIQRLFLHSLLSSLHSEYSQLLQYDVSDSHGLQALVLGLEMIFSLIFVGVRMIYLVPNIIYSSLTLTLN